MKKITALFITLALILGLCACARSATATWQEQYDLGVRYLSECNYREAIIAFNAAIEIDPKQVDVYMNLADAYIALGDLDSALQALRDGYAATGDTRIQARIDELTASEPTPTLAPTPMPTPEPTPEPNPEQSGANGSITFSGDGRNMTMSLTYPGLPDEVLVEAYRGVYDAIFSVAFSDGNQTFRVTTGVIDRSNDQTYMTVIPNGDACEHELTVSYYDLKKPEIPYWFYDSENIVATTRSNDTLTWSFTVPDAGFSISEIRYIGYQLYYYNSESDYTWDQATFAVENGELTYLNDSSVEDLGFIISAAELDALYRHW